MAKLRQVNGQTLVELALVLPCFCLGVFMAVQLMTYCHNMIELQRMTQVTIDRLSYENYRAHKNLSRFNSLWGRFTAPEAYFSSDRPQPWRPFRGASTVKQAGRLFSVKVGLNLKPNAGFSKVLATVKQESVGETYLEPPIPPEE